MGERARMLRDGLLAVAKLEGPRSSSFRRRLRSSRMLPAARTSAPRKRINSLHTQTSWTTLLQEDQPIYQTTVAASRREGIRPHSARTLVRCGRVEVRRRKKNVCVPRRNSSNGSHHHGSSDAREAIARAHRTETTRVSYARQIGRAHV